MRKRAGLLLLFICLLFTGCQKTEEKKEVLCHMVFEEHPNITIEEPVQTVRQGESVTFSLRLPEGYDLLDVDAEEAVITRDYISGKVLVRLDHVQYSRAIRGDFVQSDNRIHYVANGGKVRLYGEKNQTITRTVWKTHLRVNTSIGTDLFERDGYTLIGWNTKADGRGEAIGLGSRFEMKEKEATLYAMWEKWTEPEAFETEPIGEYAAITGYHPERTKDPSRLVIPNEIDGRPVLMIKEDAISDDQIETLILPLAIRSLEKRAVTSAGLKTLYLYDSIKNLDDYSLIGCPNLRTMHLNAVEAPVYSNHYFATFQDKFDRLFEIRDQKKIVLFSGSSTRFGYDSEKMEQAFPGYQVVNMGVFAYSNALPQLMLVKEYMKEGDILLDSPEFDAAKRQFFTTNELDDSFFCMMEANYDALTLLDLRQFRKVFSSLGAYLTEKEGMTAQDYRVSPADFDEDGNPLSGEKSYNKYGDYILYRENADTDAPIYNLPVEYTVAAFPKEVYLEPANRVWQQLLDQGIEVYFTYSPRNREAISKDSTPKERKRLDQYFRKNLVIPVISDLEESLYKGRYLYGTDNHLSTEGVKIRTEKVIQDLKKQKEGK